MKKYFFLLFIILIYQNSIGQVYKNNIDLGAAILVTEDPLMTVGVEYQLNFKRKEKTFWTYNAGLGAIFNIQEVSDEEFDRVLIPYWQSGVEYNTSQDGKNFFYAGLSIMLVIPEFHFGYKYIHPENGTTFRMYFSDSYLPFEAHYIRLGVAFGYPMNKK